MNLCKRNLNIITNPTTTKPFKIYLKTKTLINFKQKQNNNKKKQCINTGTRLSFILQFAKNEKTNFKNSIESAKPKSTVK